jgi:hypothetical protein
VGHGQAKDVDDAARTDTLRDQITDPVAAFTADGAYDQDRVYQAVAELHPNAAVVVPPRSTAALSTSTVTTPTRRDQHIQEIAVRGRMGWQKSSGYNVRAKVEAAIGKYKRVIGDALRSRTDETEATEVAIAAQVLNQMLGFGRPSMYGPYEQLIGVVPSLDPAILAATRSREPFIEAQCQDRRYGRARRGDDVIEFGDDNEQIHRRYDKTGSSCGRNRRTK